MKPAFRASELDRVLTCNGSIRLVPLVAPRAGDEGHEGSYLHWAIADRLVRLHGAIPPEGGLPPPDVPKGYKLPAFSTWIVDWAVRHVLETIPSHWALFVELSMSNSFPRWDNTGHGDIMGLSPDGDECIGIDWKTGRDPVDPADNNEQVADYLVLAKCEWPSLRRGTFQIAQPRADEDSGFERVSTVVVDDLDALVASIDRRVCAAMDNDRELNSGKKQCRWCAVGAQCPALQKEKERMKHTLTDEDIARVKREPDDAVLGDWVVTLRTLKRPTEDAEALLHERLDKVPSITAPDGTVITRKVQKGAYSVPDPQRFLATMRTILPSDESLARVMKPSMTAVKDEIATVMNVPKTSKGGVSAESVFDATLRPCVEQGERKLLIFT